MKIRLLIIRALHKGFPPLDPDLLFVLTQKGGKKVKTSPTSLEKLTLSWLKPSKLAPTSLKQDDLYANFTCFSAHRTRSGQPAMERQTS